MNRVIATINIAFFRRHLQTKWTNLKKGIIVFGYFFIDYGAYTTKEKRCYWTCGTQHAHWCKNWRSRTNLPEYWLSMFGMTEQDFDYLLNLVSPIIRKQDTLIRGCISAREYFCK